MHFKVLSVVAMLAALFRPFSAMLCASTYKCELVMAEEKKIANIAQDLLEEYRQVDINEDIALTELKRLVTIVSEVPQQPLPLTDSHYPLDTYASFRRLLYDWPQVINKLKKTRQTDFNGKQLASFKQFFRYYDMEKNSELKHKSVTQSDLERLELSLQEISHVYNLTKSDLKSNALPDSQLPAFANDLGIKPWYDTLSIPGYEPHKELCKGVQTMQVKRYHKCYYETRYVPYLRAKIEVLNDTPYVRIYHDIVRKKQRTDIMKLGAERLHTSTVMATEKTSVKIMTNVRLSSTSWLSPQCLKPVQRLYDTVRLWTGLNVDTKASPLQAEAIQMVNYGLGGKYDLHHDYHDPQIFGPRDLPPHVQGSGERLLTWMVYFNAPKVGGATVFPRLGLSVQPVQGSALVWENLRPDGSFEPLTLHGGCPVAVGQKWIGNVWVRYNAQIFTRPCPKDCIKKTP